MCLIFISVRQHPDYKLIVAANRDEFYQRKTAPANFWEEAPELLAGRDLEAGGTWMGITRTGRLSMVTNYRDPANIMPAAPSRGKLVADFLTGDEPPASYLHSTAKSGNRYNGFNLVVGDVDDLWYYSNYGKEAIQLKKGLYGLSNHLLDTPWPKVTRGKEKFGSLLASGNVHADAFFDLLFDEERADDKQLPDTGVGIERERALSSMFIKTNGYGSRSSSVIMVDHENNIAFTERVFDLQTFHYKEQSFQFRAGTKKS